MQGQNIIRALLFVVFFGIGVSTLGGSILCEELLRYYRNKQLLKEVQESSKELKSQIADYDALLRQCRDDPNLFERIAPAILGTEPADANTIYPRATPEQLAAAKKALTKDSSYQVAEPMIPRWLIRCSEPARRIMLFLAGAFLILISFMWFGSCREQKTDGRKQKTDSDL